jgi:molybdate transport system ATP-binding protein
MLEVERLADVLVLLESGKVAAHGPISEVLADPRLPISRRPEAATVLAARVNGFDANFNLTEMSVNNESLLVPGRAGEPGGMVRVRIAAADVSLAPERPSRTSILNVLHSRVMDIEPIDDAQVNVLLSIGQSGGGPRLLARISRRACQTLGFAPGQAVYAQVKAVRLIAPGRSTLLESGQSGFELWPDRSRMGGAGGSPYRS